MRTCCCSICHQQGHNRRSCPSKSRMDTDSKSGVPSIHCEDISSITNSRIDLDTDSKSGVPSIHCEDISSITNSRIVLDSDSKDEVSSIHCEDISSTKQETELIVQPLEIQSKFRKKVETNAFELVCVILLSLLKQGFTPESITFETIQSFIEEYTHIHTLNAIYIQVKDQKTYEGYLQDLQIRMKLRNSKKIITQYIQSFLQGIYLQENIHIEKITDIYLSGKGGNQPFIIQSFNKGLSQSQTKADIYIIQSGGDIIGLSIKQSYDATLSNLSLYNIISPKEKQICLDAHSYMISQVCSQPSKKERNIINSYLHNPHCSYWSVVRDIIYKNKDSISKYITNTLYSQNVKYPLFEFDGKTFSYLNSPDMIIHSTMDEYLSYYTGKNGKLRKAAKLFYQLIVSINDTKYYYRIELRWKGDNYKVGVSPQFLTHKEPEPEPVSPLESQDSSEKNERICDATVKITSTFTALPSCL
jgi:hypothetical protein